MGNHLEIVMVISMYFTSIMMLVLNILEDRQEDKQ